MGETMLKSSHRAATTVAAVVAATLLSVQAHAQQGVKLDLPAQPLEDALRTLGFVSNTNIVFDPGLMAGVTAPAINGTMTAEQALEKLLSGTKLRYKFVDDKTVSLMPASAAKKTTAGISPIRNLRLAQSDAASPSQTRAGDERQIDVSQDVYEENPLTDGMTTTRGIPEILVKGSRALNMDIRRDRDDVQPYVIFEREVIERSGSSNLGDFLKQRLPMNSVAKTNGQTAGTVLGGTSTVNLRGLGSNQTLILIDGRRAPQINQSGNPTQADLNGLPLSAIERIEILPTTASGIYGGSATGGVINVILRRDYQGMEAKVAYGSSFDSDVSMRRVELNGGFSLENGRTNVMFAGSYSDANELLTGERDFVRRGRARVAENNPAYFDTASTPPLGATPNIRSVDGSPLFGPGTASFTSVPVGYAGGQGLAPLQANAGTYNLDLPDSAQAGGARQSLLNTPQVESLLVTIRRDFGDRVQAFLEASGSSSESRFNASSSSATLFTVNADAPNNPFGQAIYVTIPTAAADTEWLVSSETRRIGGGAIAELPAGWQMSVDYSWSESQLAHNDNTRLDSALATEVSSGAIDVLRDTSAFPLDIGSSVLPMPRSGPFNMQLKDMSLRLAGPLRFIPVVTPTLTTLISHRDESFDELLLHVAPTFVLPVPSRSQSVDSVYVEARIPLVSPERGRAGLKELELQLTARHDRYEINGSEYKGSYPDGEIVSNTTEVQSTDPTLGLRYRPMQALTLRASWGTGFLPPSVNQLVPSDPYDFPAGLWTDPRRGNTPLPEYLQFTGGNPNLTPEESESWSAGLIFEPGFAPGLRMSVDYTRIEKTNNIELYIPQQTLLDNEHLFPERVVRGPNLPGDEPGWAGPVTALDLTAANISRAMVEAYDFQVDYRWQTAFGAFDFFAVGTRQTHYKTQLAPSAAEVDNVGVGSNYPLKLKANAGVTWQYRNWTLNWTANHFDSYVVSTSPAIVLNQGSSRVPSQTYHDLFAGYRFAKSPAALQFLNNAEVQLTVKNLFNKAPPFDASAQLGSVFQQFYSPYGDPRLATYEISFRMGF